MSDVFANATAALAATMEGAAGEIVRWDRGGVSLSLTAWRSPQPAAFSTLDGAGAVVEYESWEWHCRAAALGTLGKPERGDLITAADARVYEVLPVPGGQPYSGDALLRVHTKLVEEEIG